jgi:hypothetical protein
MAPLPTHKGISPFLNAIQSQDSAYHAMLESYKIYQDRGAQATRRNERSDWA